MVLLHWSKPSHLELDKWTKPFICLTHTLIWLHVLLLVLHIYSVQLGKLRLIKCKKWGQGLCGSNFSVLLLVLLLQSWGQYKARIQILGHMYMAGRASTIVFSSCNRILLIFRYKYNKLRFTIDYSPFCSNFPNPLILPANQPWKQHTLDMVVAIKKQV